MEPLEGSYDPLLIQIRSLTILGVKIEGTSQNKQFEGLRKTLASCSDKKQITQTYLQLMKKFIHKRYNAKTFNTMYVQPWEKFMTRNSIISENLPYVCKSLRKKLVLSLTTVVFFSVCCYFFVSIQKKIFTIIKGSKHLGSACLCSTFVLVSTYAFYESLVVYLIQIETDAWFLYFFVLCTYH